MAKTIVITGASDGIGAAAARHLRAKGHRLLLVGRSPAKTAAVAQELRADHFIADFARLDDVRRLVTDLRAATDRIDVLANNAGGVFGDRTVTVDGHEKTFQVNYLAPFLLTQLLLGELISGEGVVVNTASSAAKLLAKFDIDDLENEKAHTPNAAYGNAKLANILHARELNRRYGADGVSAVAFDPGNVRTNFAADSSSILRFVYRTPLSRLVLISPGQGGANLAFFADGTPGTTWMPGQFYAQTKPASGRRTNPLVHDDALAATLWERSEALLA